MEHLMNLPSLPCFSSIPHYPFGLSVSIFARPSGVCCICISTIKNFVIAHCADTLKGKGKVIPITGLCGLESE